MELDKFGMEELKVVADKLGVNYPGNILEPTLRAKLEKHIADNPDCIGDTAESTEKTTVEDTPTEKDGPVKEEELDPVKDAPLTEIKGEETIVVDKLDSAKDQLKAMEDLDQVIANATAKKNKIDQSTKIPMKSKFRGVIVTSLGSIDFGTEGEATVTAKQAQFLSAMNGYEIC